eukprot:7273575-Prymnesium_polylepis.1
MRQQQMRGHVRTHMNPVTPTWGSLCRGVANPLGRGSHPCAGATPPLPACCPRATSRAEGGRSRPWAPPLG